MAVGLLGWFGLRGVGRLARWGLADVAVDVLGWLG